MTKEELDQALQDAGGNPELFWTRVFEAGRNVEAILSCRTPAEALNQGFTWAGTPEGAERYWRPLHVKLTAIKIRPVEYKSSCKCYWDKHPLFCTCKE